jgi:UDP-2,3-diacylglucosamine hydrolase
MTSVKRYGIIAGNGLLPVTVAQRLADRGDNPFVIGIEAEADKALAKFDFIQLPLEKIAYSVPLFKEQGVGQAIFAGGVKLRPKASKLRVPMSLWPDLPNALLALKRGDDGLLAAMVRMFERHGVSIVGAHEILPDHVAAYGVISGIKPKAALSATVQAGVSAAKIIGAHDIGQAVVALGRRVIAVEGIEGTDQMLARIAALRHEGRIQAHSDLVLVKIAKPNQELRADMPVIGPATIEGCKAAGIGLICISAGSTMMMDVARTLESAKMAGINIFGINPDDWSSVAA